MGFAKGRNLGGELRLIAKRRGVGSADRRPGAGGGARRERHRAGSGAATGSRRMRGGGNFSLCGSIRDRLARDASDQGKAR
jgi:hypothetical protein